ncbi:MAG: tyrosine-type recombinase/integrase [Clostridia bacterium]|nr:tyrosine-type recombinase/integrase [Clostridia bacterium]
MEGKKYSKNVVRDTSKGIRYETEPFRSKKDTEKIKQYLLGKENKRDYALFVIGCNIGLRCQDLLALKVGDVSNSKRDIKDRVQIIEQKTNKLREFKLNQAAKDALLLYLDSMDEYNPENWLFPSRKGDEALEVDSVRRILKGLGEELNIRGNFGAHSLRRTFGYRVYRDNIEKDPMVLAKLQKIFNHSSPLITMRYIGLTSQSIDELYDNVDV